MVNFGPLTTKLKVRMSAHLMSTVRVLRMLMHLSSGHVTLLPGEFHPPEIFFQSDLGRRADSRWALSQIFILFYFCFAHYIRCRYELQIYLHDIFSEVAK